MSDIFAKRLKTERESKGWTQEYMAQLLGISNGTLSGYERKYREPDLETLTNIAMLLNISLDYLLGKTDIKEPYKEGEYCILDDEWPEVANILRRKGKKATPADKRRIAKIIEAAIEDTEE